MIKKTLYFLLTFSSIFSFRAGAQNEVDALRYSTYNLTGSAKFSSMGGAFGALGGEFSALSQNPAGIGMYQFSEISFVIFSVVCADVSIFLPSSVYFAFSL